MTGAGQGGSAAQAATGRQDRTTGYDIGRERGQCCGLYLGPSIGQTFPLGQALHLLHGRVDHAPYPTSPPQAARSVGDGTEAAMSCRRTAVPPAIGDNGPLRH
nr:hypothetical protein GCM10020093_018420 [Planobispora longispora]